MPATKVYLFQNASGESPVRSWLRALYRADPVAHAKCQLRITRLAEAGHELRRPEADYLRDGIHELRARKGHVNYRILYFFLGRNAAVLAHAITKEDAVPDIDIERAVDRRRLVLARPWTHLHEV